MRIGQSIIQALNTAARYIAKPFCKLGNWAASFFEKKKNTPPPAPQPLVPTQVAPNPPAPAVADAVSQAASTVLDVVQADAPVVPRDPRRTQAEQHLAAANKVINKLVHGKSILAHVVLIKAIRQRDVAQNVLDALDAQES